MLRRRLAACGLTVAGLAAAWALWLSIVGGFDFAPFGLRIRSNEPLRPMAIAEVALAIFVLAHGPARVYATWKAMTSGIRDGWIATALVAGTFAVGLFYGSTSIGGSDSYGYVSEVDLWMRGDLKVAQPWVAQVPWPAGWPTFSPLGYRPVEAAGQISDVPTYSPGLPLLMAAAKSIGGQRAVFLIGPLFASVMVLATWGIGCRLGSSRTGLIGAWLVATSPIVMRMTMSAMSDIPAGSAWTIALYFLLGTTLPASFAAGIFSALGLLIRPNLVYLAAIMGMWLLVREVGPESTRRTRLAHIFCFGLPVIAAALAIAAVNHYLYGAVTTSGYGKAEEILIVANLWPNLRMYLHWFVATQSPLALVAFAAVFLPIPKLWPSVPDRRVLWIIALLVLANWAQYCAYLVFDESTYLRFFLPTWPLLMLGMASVAVAVMRAGRPALTLLAIGAVIGLGLRDLRTAAIHGSFDVWRSERRFPAAATLVRERTAPASVVFAMLHSGSVRDYAGRVTLRYDQLDPQWLDRSVAWLDEHGVHSYALLDEWEVDIFKKQFAGQSLVTRLERPLLVYRGTDTVLLFDLSRGADASERPVVFNDGFERTLRAQPPAPLAELVFTR